jgi:double-stranded uracil-DNA glycosylase
MLARARPARPQTPSSGSTLEGLADVLGPRVRLLFCGINPGLRSAAAQRHFANPRNDFWRLLAACGLTPRVMTPDEQDELPALGLGITNAAGRPTRGSGDLRRGDFAGAAGRLEQLAHDLELRGIAFVGKAAYQGAFGGRPQLGLQQDRLEAAWLFVLPSTSPANAAVPWEERLRWFRALAAQLREDEGG